MSKIYMKNCPYCGIEFKTADIRKIFCSHRCANSGRRIDRGNFDNSLDWTKHDGKWDCPYQTGVGCSVRYCDRCGWHPDVAKARLDKIMGVE